MKKKSVGPSTKSRVASTERKAYAAHVITHDGVRQRIDGRTIVVAIAGGELEIQLENPFAAAAGKLNVFAKDGWLILGPGDGNSVWLDIKPWKKKRARKP